MGMSFRALDMKQMVQLQRSSWIVVATIITIGFVIAGSTTGVIGPVFNPIMSELAWSNRMTSSLATGYTVGTVVTAPIIGIALDRFGPRAVMTAGAGGIAAALFVLCKSHSWCAILGAFTCIGVGSSACCYLPCVVLITSWMSTQKSLGIGIVMGATSAGAAVFTPLIGTAIEIYGWRPAVEALAVLISLMLPLIWFAVKSNPANSPQILTTMRNGVRPYSIKEAFASPAFVLAIASSALFSIGMLSIYYHVVPLLVAVGYSAHQAGFAFGSTWLLSGVGSLLLGILADRYGTRFILAGALFCVALGTLFLLAANHQTHRGLASVIVFVLLWGLSANCFAQLAPVIFTERFGSQNLGRLVGLQAAVSGVAGSAAPLITGVLYDRFGGYHAAVAFSASATFIAFTLVLLINPRVAAGELIA